MLARKGIAIGIGIGRMNLIEIFLCVPNKISDFNYNLYSLDILTKQITTIWETNLSLDIVPFCFKTLELFFFF